MPDQQDPLPEGSFFWRRVFSAAVVGVLLAIAFWAVWGMTDALLQEVKTDRAAMAIATSLRDVIFYIMCVIGLISTYYLLAPSGEQLALIVQSAKIAIAKIPALPGRSRPAMREPEYEDDEEDYAPTRRDRR